MAREAPLRDVVEVRELKGPRGGTKFVHKLSCGCLVWRNARRPAKRIRCVTCWWGRAPRPSEEIIDRLASELAGARAALHTYGRHTELCGITGGYGECTCGLSAARGDA